MSITKRINKNGSVSWVAVVDAPRDAATNKRKQLRRSFNTRREALAWERGVLTDIRRGSYVPPDTKTVGEYLEEWLEGYARSACRPNTFDRYAGLIRGHIIPALGRIRLDQLTPLDLTRFYSEKREQGRLDGQAGGLSPRTIRYLHATLHESLRHAVQWGLVTRNVADAVRPPKLERHEMATWGSTDVERFLSESMGSRYHLIFKLALYTGLRRGELLGLRWSDLNLDRHELTVRQTLIDRNGKLEFGHPKSHRSRRPVEFTSALSAELREHRARQHTERLRAGSMWQHYDLVFATPLGGPVQPSNLARAFRAITRAAGLPPIRFHDLRHTHATLLFAAGAHPKVVAERLGHGSITLTLDTYSHVMPGMQRDAVDRLDAFLSADGAATRIL